MAIPLEREIEKMMELHERHLMSEALVVEEFVSMLAGTDGENTVLSLFDFIPGRFQPLVLERLRDIARSGFEWRPVIIGEGPDENKLIRLRKQLRFVHDLLCGK